MPPTTKSRRASSPKSESPEEKYAVSTWGSTSKYEDLTFPSGQVALVRRPGLEGLMKAGILHNLDTLTPIIDKHKSKASGKKAVEVDVTELLKKDPKVLEDMIHLVDRILCHCVVKPEIEMTPNDSTRREQGVVYADMVELDDKFFLFNYAVGGTRDLERFRLESEKSVGSVRSLQEDEAASE